MQRLNKSITHAVDRPVKVMQLEKPAVYRHNHNE